MGHTASVQTTEPRSVCASHLSVEHPKEGPPQAGLLTVYDPELPALLWAERTQRLILKRVLRREYTASCRKRLGGQLASAVRPGRRPLQSQRAESAAPFPGVPRRNSSAFSSVTRVTGHRQSSSLAPRAPSRSLRSSGATCAGASGSPPTKTGGAPTRPATTASSFSSVPYARSASSATPSTPRLRHCPGRGRRRLLVGRERRRASRRKS